MKASQVGLGSELAVALNPTEDHLGPTRKDEIDEQYRRAYADGEGLGPEWEGWEEQGVWPPE